MPSQRSSFKIKYFVIIDIKLLSMVLTRCSSLEWLFSFRNNGQWGAMCPSLWHLKYNILDVAGRLSSGRREYFQLHLLVALRYCMSVITAVVALVPGGWWPASFISGARWWPPWRRHLPLLVEERSHFSSELFHRLDIAREC